MGLKNDAALVKLPQLGERHDLEAAGISENWMRPVHEFVQAAQSRHPFGAWPQHQMISIAEQNVGAERAYFAGVHRLHRSRCSDRHEGWRSNGPARHGDFAAPRRAVAS